MASNIGWLYDSAQQFTFAVQSLASDTSLLAGRAGTAIDLTQNVSALGSIPALDWWVSGFFKTAASVTTGKQIELWFAGLMGDGNYPDSISGTDGNKTISTADIKARLACWDIVTIDGTARTYPVRQGALSAVFGGRVPPKVVPFLVHNTGQNLDSTAGNHKLYIAPGGLKTT